MAGTNMNTVLSFIKDAVSAQQNASMQGLGCTAAASGETSTGFDEYMKASVSTTEEHKNYRSVEKTAATATESAKTADVKQIKYSERSTVDETAADQKEKNQTQDILSAVGTENQDSSANTEISGKIQEFLESAEKTIDLPEDLQEALGKIQEQLMQKIMDGFDITEDELKEALEVLAISIYDLLQTDNLKELAVYVSSEESLISLVTNGDMYEAYKEVAAGIEEVSIALMERFSLTQEELQQIMTQLENQPETVISVNRENISGEEIMAENSGTSDAMAETKQPEILLEVSKTMEPTEKEKANDVTAFQENSSIQLEEKVTETVTEDSTSQQQKDFSSASDGGEKKTAANSNENAGLQTNTSYATVVTENQVQTVVKTQQTDFDGIVRQIVEQIKVEIKPDVSSMELQLNPENLGKVNLHVASKEGVITAQFFVQNETVKTMIEGQLEVLRDAMNEQGVKVEAVEVTVETGQFGRSLEQHSEQQKQEAEKQAKSYQHRAINLLAGLDDESMNEEELLRAHIMRESGNSVDMNA